METIAPALKPGAILSDVGSVKAHVVKVVWRRWCRRASISFPAIRSPAPSIPARRPGFAELFVGRWCVLTPGAGVDRGAGRAARRVLARARLQGRDHGRRATTTWCSPSPATCRISSPTTSSARSPTSKRDTKSEVIKFSASGFRDFTRIAASDPVMWRDVFLTNRDAVLEMLGRFLEDLERAAARGARRRRRQRSRPCSPAPAPSAARSSMPGRKPRPPISAGRQAAPSKAPAD